MKLPPVGGWMCYPLLRFAYRLASRLEFYFCYAILAIRTKYGLITDGYGLWIKRVTATSKKTELKLTNAERASLEELHLDFEDYLRQHSSAQWAKDHPLAQEFIKRRISSIQEFREFIRWSLQQKYESVNVGSCPLQSVIVANSVLLLLNTTCYFLDRQIIRLATDFEKEGGFTEKIYKVRSKERSKQ